ncbi:MAG TPA: hypothetical protein VHT70_05280 [Candidatus Saccharimonadales bacterium]|nr:hypothetical protein [Candidatus Saccharimonadales bacterium]
MRDLPPNAYEPHMPENLDHFLNLPSWPGFIEPHPTGAYYGEIAEPPTFIAESHEHALYSDNTEPDGPGNAFATQGESGESVSEEGDGNLPRLLHAGERAHWRHAQSRSVLGRLLLGGGKKLTDPKNPQ